VPVLTDQSPASDDIRTLLGALSGPDEEAATSARARDLTLTKPAGSLSRLEELAVWLARWQGRSLPTCDRPAMVIFAGSHGVAQRGVSAFPSEVTGQMVANFESGGAAINQLCRENRIDLSVVDLGWERPTRDFTVEPALSHEELTEAFRRGREAVPEGADVLGVGEMGIGNTTVAAALYAATLGGGPGTWVGRGTGVDDAGLARKEDAVEAALARHAEHLDDPWQVMRRVGGRELAALAGAILQARLSRIPVVLDGFVTTAAAAVLHALDPSALDHCLAGHVSAEQAHAAALERLGLDPLLDLGLRLGEGSGAALAIGILRSAVAVHRGMATFGEAGVASKVAEQ